MARRVGERAVLLAPGVAVLRRSAGSAATRWRTTRSARAGRSPRRRGGSRRTSATAPRTSERRAWATSPGLRSACRGPGDAVARGQSEQMTESLRAVLFDMDGTLVETEELWGEAAVRARRSGWAAGCPPRPAPATDRLDHAARRWRSSTRDLGRDPDRGRSCMADARWVEDAHGRADGRTSITWQPGRRELLAAVRDAGLATALVTTTPRRIAEIVLTGRSATISGSDPFDLTDLRGRGAGPQAGPGAVPAWRWPRWAWRPRSAVVDPCARPLCSPPPPSRSGSPSWRCPASRRRPTATSYQAQLARSTTPARSGTLMISLNGSQATITEHVTGLAATFSGTPYPHVQHIHIGAKGECPTMAADTNNDGVISTTEGAPATARSAPRCPPRATPARRPAPR